MSDEQHEHTPLQRPEDCDGPCPECGACTHNNGACGDPECCGFNYSYCVHCDWVSG